MSVLEKKLFLDDRFIDEMSDLVRRFGRPEVCPENPVIRADRPWEKGAAFVDTGLVLYDEQEGCFKAWYQGGPCYGPDDGSIMCYATSPDGVHWEKPALGVVDFEGSRENNIVLRADCMMHDPAVILDRKDPDPSRRYKAVWWGGRRDPSAEGGWLLGHAVGFSPDGIHWTEHPDNPVWPADAEVAIPFDLERREGPLVVYSSADGYGMRVVGRIESDDFVHWKRPPRLVFRSDEDDPPGTEMAGLAGVEYFGTYVGMLWVIRNLPGFTPNQWRRIVQRNIRQGFFGPPIALNAVRCRIMFTELVTSVDGVHWERIRREPFLPMGGEGTWDECISLIARPVVAKDRIYLYYTGQGRTKRTPGSGRREKVRPWNLETGLAFLRLDGWACLETRDGEGALLTRSFNLAARRICVNLEAPSGALQAELLDHEGRPLPGFTREACRPVTGDQLCSPLEWNGRADLSDLLGRRLKMRLYLRDARLYSLSFLRE